MRATTIAGAILFVLMAASETSAQVCFGGPSFNESPVHVSGLVSASGSASAFGGQALVGFGKAFGGATFAAQKLDGFDGTGIALDVIGGADVAVRDGLYVCPVASALFQSGPDFGSTEVSAKGFTGGGNVGFVLNTSANGIRTILHGGVIGIHQQVTYRDEQEQSVSSNYAVARLGVGVVYKRLFVVTGLQLPINAEGADRSLNVSAGFAF